jgi:hypothetical protein
MAHPKASRLLQIYINVTCAYGLAHAIPYVWSYKTSLYNTLYTETKREMLLVDKVGLVVANTVTAPFMWPFLLREDLIRLECFARGRPAQDYLPASDDT